MTRSRALVVVSVVVWLLGAGCGRESSRPGYPQTARTQPLLQRPSAEASGDSASVAQATAEPSGETSFAVTSPAGSESDDFGYGAAGPEAPADSAAKMSMARGESAAPVEAERFATRGMDRGERSKYYFEPYRRPQMQSGLLTAGSIDDHAAFAEYRQFLNDSLRRDPYVTRLPIGQRVVIQVTDASGIPVGDARVVVQAAEQHSSLPPMIDLTTGSDGRTVWLTGIGGATPTDDELVTVHPPGGGKPVCERLHWDQQPWQIQLPDVQPSLPVQLDLALVIDTTGSMGDELEYLKAEIDDIAATIHRMFPNVDQRYALIVYRDQGDQYVLQSYGFTDSLSEFRGTLAGQHAAGGGDYPEAVHLAMQSATHLDWRTRNTARVLFLVGDAPPHDADVGQTFEAVKSLRRQGVRVFPVAGSGTQWKAEFILRATSFLTMGKYLFLTDHSGVGAPHADPHVSSYQVEHLNRLMVRMVAEQLAGRTLAADEILAFENGRQPVPVQQQYPQVVVRQRPVAQTWCITPPRARWSWSDFAPPRWLLLGLVLCAAFVVDFLRDRRCRG